jgi:hypothetical protein
LKCTRNGPTAFTVEFEDAVEVLRECRDNLAMGGLLLQTDERLPLHSNLMLTLRGPFGATESLRATVVAPLPGGVALAVKVNEKELMDRLLERVVHEAVEAEEEPRGAAGGEPTAVEEVPAAARTAQQNPWDRIRGMDRMQKILLAGKAERTERALLLQDNDPQVLLSLLKNPRLTVDEVVRIAKSPYLTYQTAEVFMKSSLWLANLDVRVALIHNPKTPPTFAMRILPTLPESEVKLIARGAATNMALKTAALRRLQTGS